MNRPPLPRYIADIHVAVEIGAADEDEADLRLDAVAEQIIARLRKTTVTRMAGKPRVVHVELGDISGA